MSVLLNESIKIKQILESESNQNNSHDKSNRVDLLVENARGELIIIEVQNNREKDFLSRVLYGTSKVITEHIQQGDAYAKVKRVICVSIVYFDLGRGDDYIYVGETKFIGLHKKDELALSKEEQLLYKDKQKVSQIYPAYYIIKVNQFDEVAKDALDEWIYFLKTEEIKSTFSAPGLQAAKKELDVMKLSKAERAQYESYLKDLRYEASTIDLEGELQREEGLKEGLAKGREEGLAKGREEGLAKGREVGEIKTTQKIAATMLKKGIDMIIVAETTGLPIETLRLLHQEVTVTEAG